MKLPDCPPDLISEQLPPPELELLLDEEELELLEDELELDDELELLELELLLDDELELEELLSPLQSAAWGLLPDTVRESMLANPPLLVATRLMLFQPEFKFTFAYTIVQLVHEPVDGKSTVVMLAPLTCTLPGRLLAPLAKRHSS